MRGRFVHLLVLIIPLLMAAAPKGVTEPVRREPAFSTKSIAVISGTNDDVNLLAVKFVTEALSQKSLLSVMPQERVARLLPHYPVNIRGPYTAAYFTYTENYANTDMAKIREIQKTLGVDYLYVLWGSTGLRGQWGRSSLHFIAQLFEGPQSKEMDSGTFTSSARGRVSLCLTFYYPTPEQEAAKLKETCESAAGDIVSLIEKRNK